MRQKILAAALVVCLSAGIPLTGQAAGQAGGDLSAGLKETVTEVPQARFTNTFSVSTSLKIEGSIAYLYADAVAKKTYPIQISMRLQKKNGSSWKTVCTWVSSKTGPSYTTTASYALKERGTYRVNVKYDVNGEIITCISQTKTY